jgi:hypothetical protein
MADVSTEVAIATQTLGSSAATITFSSIPSTYTDLRLVLTTTTVSTGENVFMTFNSDTATNYSRTLLYGDGTSAASARATNSAFLIWTTAGGTSSTIPSFFTADIFSYAGSTYKTSLLTSSEDKNGSGAVERYVALWRSTSAITRLDINTGGGSNFAAGTTATLYGIL